MAVIPKGVLALRHVAATERYRYPTMEGVRIERQENKLIATATDGKRLARVTLDDTFERERFPETGLKHGETVQGFTTVLHADALEKAEKSMPRTKRDAHLQVLAIEEPTANGTVNLATTDGKTVTRTSVPSLEGDFPPVTDVIPPADKPYGTIRIGINAELLYSLALALRAAVGREKADPVVVLEIKDERSAVRVLVSQGEQQALGAVAPVTIDTARTISPEKAVGLVMPVNVA